jgi:hypothetical protein
MPLSVQPQMFRPCNHKSALYGWPSAHQYKGTASFLPNCCVGERLVSWSLEFGSNGESIGRGCADPLLCRAATDTGFREHVVLF